MENKESDIYRDVTLEIRDVIQEDLFDSELGFDEEVQKKVTEILERNFDKRDERMGKILMGDTNVFRADTGNIIDIPLFMVPLAIKYGFRPITQSMYPNYNINNEYMGYTDEGVFYKIKKVGPIAKFLLRIDKIILAFLLIIFLGIIIKTIMWG